MWEWVFSDGAECKAREGVSVNSSGMTEQMHQVGPVGTAAALSVPTVC
jgi:hypothetical protein